MNIRILCVGKIKEAYWRDAIEEYSKRLARFCKLEILEVEDEKTPDKQIQSEVVSDRIKKTEGDRLRRYVKESDYVIALCVEGKQWDSPAFADKLSGIMTAGYNDIDFIIGGSLGIDEALKQLASDRMSFSKLTFPHQMMRVVLLEQIYRCFKIMNHEPYHK